MFDTRQSGVCVLSRFDDRSSQKQRIAGCGHRSLTANVTLGEDAIICKFFADRLLVQGNFQNGEGEC